MNIGITGADGLLGWHLRAYLAAHRFDGEIKLAGRATFADPHALAAFAKGLDVIVHLAGVNRAEDSELETANPAIARTLLAACDAAGAAPFIIYANSTHSTRDTPYGRGKRAAADVLRHERGGFANVILPHIFGEFGKPFYNSAVSTFCHQLASGQTPTITADGEVELVHTQDVAAYIMALAHEKKPGEYRLEGARMRVSELLARLSSMHQDYAQTLMPPLSTPLDVRLFNTLRSYLFPAHYPVSLPLRSDARGSLFEAVKSGTGGQVFLSTTHPGITRGNHFHTRKVERFLVAGGQATIRLRKLFSPDIISFDVSGDAPCYIDMPTFFTHDITNTGSSELLTLFWANEIFDAADPDTISEPVGSL